MTELYHACDCDDIKTIKQLLSNGADIDEMFMENDTGAMTTCLISSCYTGCYKMTKILLENNANVHIRDNMQNNAMHYACFYGDIEIVKLLLKYGASLKCEDRNGCNGLHIAVKYGCIELVKYALKNGIGVDETNNDESTSLHIACYQNVSIFFKLIKLLIKNGSNVNLFNRYGDTPLRISCNNNDYLTCRLLLDNNANINEIYYDGNTPFHVACNGKNYMIPKMMINKYPNMDLKKRNNNGETPYALAEKNDNHEVCTLLRKTMLKRLYIYSLIVQHDVFKHHIVKKTMSDFMK